VCARARARVVCVFVCVCVCACVSVSDCCVRVCLCVLRGSACMCVRVSCECVCVELCCAGACGAVRVRGFARARANSWAPTLNASVLVAVVNSRGGTQRDSKERIEGVRDEWVGAGKRGRAGGGLLQFRPIIQ
jgi:hypothetical protein